MRALELRQERDVARPVAEKAPDWRVPGTPGGQLGTWVPEGPEAESTPTSCEAAGVSEWW